MNSFLISIFFIIVAMLISMVIHEIAHAATAYWLGDDTAKVEGRLTVNPIAHIDPFLSVIMPIFCISLRMPIIGGAKPVPVNSRKLKYGDWGMALVALAGPVSNLIMAFMAFGLFSILRVSSGLLGEFLIIFIKLNLGLMLFNLLPIPPLDGSKIIYPLAPDFVQNIINQMERSSWLAFMIVMIFTEQISSVIGFGQEWILSLFAIVFR